MVLFFSGGDRYKALYFKPGGVLPRILDRGGLQRFMNPNPISREGGGGGVLPYVGHICAAVKGMVFKQFTLA